jgi:hypothetical protein
MLTTFKINTYASVENKPLHPPSESTLTKKAGRGEGTRKMSQPQITERAHTAALPEHQTYRIESNGGHDEHI